MTINKMKKECRAPGLPGFPPPPFPFIFLFSLHLFASVNRRLGLLTLLPTLPELFPIFNNACFTFHLQVSSFALPFVF